jgi:hypothetical protein
MTIYGFFLFLKDRKSERITQHEPARQYFTQVLFYGAWNSLYCTYFSYARTFFIAITVLLYCILHILSIEIELARRQYDVFLVCIYSQLTRSTTGLESSKINKVIYSHQLTFCLFRRNTFLQIYRKWTLMFNPFLPITPEHLSYLSKVIDIWILNTAC